MGLDDHPGRDTNAAGPTWRAMLRIPLPASGSEGMVRADCGAAHQLRVHQVGQVRQRAWTWVYHSTWTPMANTPRTGASPAGGSAHRPTGRGGACLDTLVTLGHD